MPTLIIAEAGVNHNGDVETAIRMVSAARQTGADLIKFQHFRTEKIVARGAGTATYQNNNTGLDSQSELLRPLELSLDEFERVAEACKKEGIGFLCTPFEEADVHRLVDLGMGYIKIPSGEITNFPMLRSYGGLGLPIILSTGMTTMHEVSDALELLEESGAKDITVLHCTSLYPAPPETLNLSAIISMQEAFQRDIGYSDHSLGDHAAIAAVALGATVIEKHFTLDREMPGPDHAASLEPEEFSSMVRRIRELELMLGGGVKQPAEGEVDVAALVRRSWHAVRDMPVGHRIAHEDVVLLRPATGLPPRYQLEGRRLARKVLAGTSVSEADLEE